jgi:HSP20 family protein
MHHFIKIRILRDLDNLEERARSFRHLWLGWQAAPSFRPAADLFETAAGLVLRLEVAGIPPEELSLSLAGQELVIQGRRRLSPPPGTARILQHEMVTGVFERRFLLPLAVDPEAVEARCLHGVLEVELPRPTARRIPVTASLTDDEQER